MNKNKKSILNEFLKIYWLRPETAIWRTIDCGVMQNFKFFGRKLDIGCGDGLFSFVRANGKIIDKKFDHFNFQTNYKNFFLNKDIFNAAPTQKKIKILKPDYKIDYGIDFKKNLLFKSKRLNFYNKLYHLDFNKRFKNNIGEFDSVFSNTIYWMKDLKIALKNLHNLLSKDSVTCLLLPSDNIKKISIYHNYKNIKLNSKLKKFIFNLDRGRFSENIIHLYDYKKWKNIFNSNGFKILHHEYYLSDNIFKIWDIGFRPMFPAFHKTFSIISHKKRIKAKNFWIENLTRISEGLLEFDKFAKKNSKGNFHYFLLKKKN